MNPYYYLGKKLTKNLVFTSEGIPHMVPTSSDTNEQAWKIGSSALSCGLKEFQGWSEGVGINRADNEKNFEAKLALLLYWSKIYSKDPYAFAHRELDFPFKGEYWGHKDLDGDMIGPIGIHRNLAQFMVPMWNMLHSGQAEWMNRIQKFVTKNNLGTYLITDTFVNHNYHRHEIQVGVWQWNGTVPDMSQFKYPTLEEVKKAA